MGFVKLGRWGVLDRLTRAAMRRGVNGVPGGVMDIILERAKAAILSHRLFGIGVVTRS